MDVRLACRAGDPSVPNEDSYLVLPGLVAVMDGVSLPAGLDSGCRHGSAWYSGRLAANLAAWYTAAPEADLDDLLGRAIETVRDEHGSECDLDHPGTPQSTVAILRADQVRCDYLVLCDSTLVLERDGLVVPVTDGRMLDCARRLRRLALTGTSLIGSPAQADAIRALTQAKREYVNRPGGYWIAAADPAAARHAIRGAMPRYGPGRLTRAALLTDGAACLVAQYRVLDWRPLLDLIAAEGPDRAIDMARAAETTDPYGHRQLRLKPHDDATVGYCVIRP
jgi:hypothetical protein